jgi:uridine kinase
VLYWAEIRKLLNVKVFVSLSESDTLSRRLERDVGERGRTRLSVISQYDNTVKPMMLKYVLPTMSLADITVNGADPVEQSASRVIARMRLP